MATDSEKLLLRCVEANKVFKDASEEVISAFEELHKSDLADRVKNFLRCKYFPNSDTQGGVALDDVLSVFWSNLRSLGHYEEQGKFEAFIFKIAENAYLDLTKSKQQRFEAGMPSIDVLSAPHLSDAPFDPPANGSTPSEPVRNIEELAEIFRETEKLPGDKCVVRSVRFVCYEFTQTQIADVINEACKHFPWNRHMVKRRLVD